MLGSFITFLNKLANSILYMLALVKNKCYKTVFESINCTTLVILANGPSLKEDLPSILENKKSEQIEYFSLNFFANSEVFFELKPHYYCFADPMFFKKNHKSEEVETLFDVLREKVNWNMVVYIPFLEYGNFISYSGLGSNPFIKIEKVNNLNYKGSSKIRNLLYKKGLATPPLATVANLAIYIGLSLGYSKLLVYGVDHTFFDNLCINQDNLLCNKESHFYSKESQQMLKPIVRNDNDEPWKISDYIEGIALMFKSHDILAEYANYLGEEIINCTKNSLIDSYKRINKDLV